MMKIYYWPNSAIIIRTLWALEELEVPHERIRLFQDKGEHKKPEYLALNPSGYMPTLVDGEDVVFESLAVLLYIAEKFGRGPKKLWPELGTPEYAKALSWQVFGTVNLHYPLLAYGQHATELHFGLPKEKRNPAVAKQAEEDSHHFLGLLEKHMEGKPYVLGNDFSLVDLSNCVFIGRAIMMRFDVSRYPNLCAWTARCTSRPIFQRLIVENAEEARRGKGQQFEKTAVSESLGWSDVARIAASHAKT